MMRIALDLDNTLFDSNIVDIVCEKYNLPKPTQFDLTDLPDYARKECFESFKSSEKMCTLSPFVTSIGIDTKLKKLGHTVYVVTARDSGLSDGTIKMVDSHFPNVDETFMVGSFDKTNQYRELGIDVVVDDNAEHIFQAIDVGVSKAVLISNGRTEYNHHQVSEAKARGAYVISDLSKLVSLLED